MEERLTCQYRLVILPADWFSWFHNRTRSWAPPGDSLTVLSALWLRSSFADRVGQRWCLGHEPVGVLGQRRRGDLLPGDVATKGGAVDADDRTDSAVVGHRFGLAVSVELLARLVPQALGANLAAEQDALLQQRGRSAVVVVKPNLQLGEQAPLPHHQQIVPGSIDAPSRGCETFDLAPRRLVSDAGSRGGDRDQWSGRRAGGLWCGVAPADHAERDTVSVSDDSGGGVGDHLVG